MIYKIIEGTWNVPKSLFAYIVHSAKYSFRNYSQKIILHFQSNAQVTKFHSELNQHNLEVLHLWIKWWTAKFIFSTLYISPFFFMISFPFLNDFHNLIWNRNPPSFFGFSQFFLEEGGVVSPDFMSK